MRISISLTLPLSARKLKRTLSCSLYPSSPYIPVGGLGSVVTKSYDRCMPLQEELDSEVSCISISSAVAAIDEYDILVIQKKRSTLANSEDPIEMLFYGGISSVSPETVHTLIEFLAGNLLKCKIYWYMLTVSVCKWLNTR